MYVCMYVCMYVVMYVCVYVCVCVCMMGKYKLSPPWVLLCPCNVCMYVCAFETRISRQTTSLSTAPHSPNIEKIQLAAQFRAQLKRNMLYMFCIIASAISDLHARCVAMQSRQPRMSATRACIVLLDSR